MILQRESSFPVTNLQHSFILPISSDHLAPGVWGIETMTLRHRGMNPNEKGYLLNNDKELFAIVHQYDRDLGLQGTYAKKFIKWVDFSGKISKPRPTLMRWDSEL